MQNDNLSKEEKELMKNIQPNSDDRMLTDEEKELLKDLRTKSYDQIINFALFLVALVILIKILLNHYAI